MMENIASSRSSTAPAAAPGLFLRLFGSVQFCAGSVDVTPRSRKARGLVAYLAVAPDRSATRERLADLLWSDSGEEQARASLRQTLVELRTGGLGGDETLAISRYGIRLDAEGARTDVEAIAAAASAGDIAALANLLEAARGPFLEDLHGLAPGFDDWLLGEQVRQLDRLLSAVVASAEAAWQQQDPQLVRRLADAVERLDPGNEQLARAAMRADHAVGDTAALHRRYRRLAEQLQREFAIEPSEETRLLFTALRAPAPPETPALAPPETPALAPPPPAIAKAEVAIPSEGAVTSDQPADWTRDEVIAQVQRITGSRTFEQSAGLRDLLGYIARNSLEARTDGLKEYAIGVDVFRRGADFDPRSDTIVRVQAVRLRKKLEEFHAAEGRGDRLIIDVPKGRYVMAVQLRGQRGAAAPEPPGLLAGGAPPPVPHNLPSPIGPMVGREDELRDLTALAHEQRLLTIAGSGGLGKTRLAIELGRSLLPTFTGGVWFIALDRLDEPTLVAETLLSTLRISTEGSLSAADQAVRFLKDRQILLIFDNAEHVLDVVTDLAVAILAGAPRAHVIITSREALTLPEEQVYRIPPLPVPPAGMVSADAILQYPAVQLMARRGRAARGAFDITDADVAAVSAICRKLDGIPLAIELAAARLRVLTPQEIDKALSDHFGILAQRHPSGPHRHRTLRATFEWSHALLSEVERITLRRLSVFAGGWTLEAAQQVASDTTITAADVFDALSSLVEKSLVIAELTAHGQRYRLLETTRAFAAEMRIEAGDRACERAFAGVVLDILRKAGREFETTPNDEYLGAYRPEIDNIRAARAWAFNEDKDIDLAVALTALSTQLNTELGLINESRRWLERAVPHVTDATPPEIASHLMLAMGFRFGTGTGEARDFCERACMFGARSGDPTLHARTLLTAVQPIRFFDPARAEALVAEANAILQPLGPTKALTFALSSRAFSASLRGDFAAADADFTAALGNARMFDYRFGLAWVEVLRFEHIVMTGDLVAARQAAVDAWEAAERSEMQGFMALAACVQASSLLLGGDPAASLKWSRLALARSEGLDHSATLVAAAIEGLALARAAADAETAARLEGFAAATRTALSSRRRPSEAGVFARLGAATTAALDPDRRSSLMSAGATLTTDAAAQLAVA